MSPEIYEPREDSLLLKEQVEKLSYGTVLDMGTGSGILAEAALKRAKKVYAADINPLAVKTIKTNKKVTACRSDLFSCFRNKNIIFDTIIFNPPYLPQDPGIEDAALYGGRHGYETIERFLSEAGKYLAPKGQVLLLFSSLTKKLKVDEFIRKNMLVAQELSRQDVFYEKLYVYRITKSAELEELEKKGVKGLKFLARGKRGEVFTGKLKGKKIAVKVKRKSSEALGRTENEASWLKDMNKIGIGPRLMMKGEDYVTYEFAEGKFILDYAKTASKAAVIKVICSLFDQCRKMDARGADKEEMHHPVKHVIIGPDGKVTMIDFERMHIAKKPKNVTQLCQFITSSMLTALLKEKGAKVDSQKLILLAKKYKESYSEDIFEKIKKEIKQRQN